MHTLEGSEHCRETTEMKMVEGRGGLRLILSSGSSSIGSDSGIASSGMAVWGGGRGTLARECRRS